MKAVQRSFISQGIKDAMNKFNAKSIIKVKEKEEDKEKSREENK